MIYCNCIGYQCNTNRIPGKCKNAEPAAGSAEFTINRISGRQISESELIHDRKPCYSQKAGLLFNEIKIYLNKYPIFRPEEKEMGTLLSAMVYPKW